MNPASPIRRAEEVRRAPRALVAHVITESLPFGGAQRNTLLTVAELLRRGFRVDLVCGPPGGELERAARAAGAGVEVVPDLLRKTASRSDLRTLWRLARLFRERRYDVVHTHSTKAGLLGRAAAWIAGVPVIVHTFHGFPFVLDRSLRSRLFIAVERLVGRITDASVCVAEALRAEVAGWGIPRPQKLVTIYSGIDFSACRASRSRQDSRRMLGLDGAWPVIGSIGHLRDAKAQEDLIEAAAILREKYPDLRLLIVGEGERRPLLEARIRALDAGGQVRLLGERSDVVDLLEVFDVYAMSSRWEGVGRALTEAMYRGLPVAVTDVYGVREVVVHEETGLAVPPGDPRALSAAIDRLVSD
ncbi:MAG: glycosyltransferase family 4 protein, partial [Candidatus Binatia bacterium]